MSAPIKFNAERGSAKLVIIILASIGAIIVLALIAILLFTPNLTKVRKAELETEAIATIRKINTSQINYSSSFENVGYAPDLASLGPGPDGKCDGGATPCSRVLTRWCAW